MTYHLTLPDAIFGAAIGAIAHGLSILVTGQIMLSEAQPTATRFELVPAILVADCGQRRDCFDLPPIAGDAP
jgi:hypothetical protein